MGGFDLSLCVLAFFVDVLPVVVNVRAKHISVTPLSLVFFVSIKKMKVMQMKIENIFWK